MGTKQRTLTDGEAMPGSPPTVKIQGRPAATLQSIQGLADEVKTLLETLLSDLKKHSGSNAADFKELWAELDKIKDQIFTIHNAAGEDAATMNFLDQLERVVNRVNRQEPSYVTIELFLDQISKVKTALQEEIDAIIDARLLRLRQGIIEDIGKVFDSSRQKEEKKRHGQIVTQTWIIGGITIILGLLSILATLSAH